MATLFMDMESNRNLIDRLFNWRMFEIGDERLQMKLRLMTARIAKDDQALAEQKKVTRCRSESRTTSQT
jgi:hypothetical protein